MNNIEITMEMKGLRCHGKLLILFYAENLTSIDIKRLSSETDFEKQTCEVLTDMQGSRSAVWDQLFL